MCTLDNRSAKERPSGCRVPPDSAPDRTYTLKYEGTVRRLIPCRSWHLLQVDNKHIVHWSIGTILAEAYCGNRTKDTEETPPAYKQENKKTAAHHHSSRCHAQRHAPCLAAMVHTKTVFFSSPRSMDPYGVPPFRTAGGSETGGQWQTSRTSEPTKSIGRLSCNR